MVIDVRGGLSNSSTAALAPGASAEVSIHVAAGYATALVSTDVRMRVRITEEDGSVATLYTHPDPQVGAMLGMGKWRIDATNWDIDAADVHFLVGWTEGASGSLVDRGTDNDVA